LTDIRVGHFRRGGSPYAVAVASGKGGTGKSVFATNLALALTKRSRKVLLVDADFGLANVHLLFGINPGGNICDLLDGQMTIRELVHSYDSVKFIPGSPGVTELASLTESQLLAFGSQLEALEDETDIIIFDNSSGLSRHTLNILLACREVIVVTTPDITAITDAYALIKAISHRNRSLRIGLVVNRAKDGYQARAIFDNMHRATLRFLKRKVAYYGHVFDDEHVTRATAEKKPVVASYPLSPSGRCLLEIAGKLDWAPDGDINFSGKLRELLNSSRE
jgi:flagellar biosynthesis protein FlhG